jgi:thiol:disulfide interchange protein DsbC
MKKILIALLFGSMLFGCEKKEQTMSQVKENLQKSVPDLPKDITVGKSPVEGFYEVSVGRKVFYVSNDSKFLIFGNVVDVATKQNLTEKRTQELSKIDFSKLPLDLAIKTVNGDGHRKIAVFSDPECPYCQMFEKQISPNLKDTTIYCQITQLLNQIQSKSGVAKIDLRHGLNG